MKKFFQKKRLFIGLIVFIFLIGCSNNAESKVNENLIIKKKDLSFKEESKEKQNIDIPYMNYDEVFDINRTQKATGKYSNTTPDGKINWDVKEYMIYDQTPIVKDMVKKITLDGKTINFPMKFKDLGDEFAEFDDIDFSKFKKEDGLLTITNKKNGYLLFIIHMIAEKGYEILSLYNKEHQFLCEIYIYVKNKNITGMSSGFRKLGIKNLRIDGIGNGNTFNEMYKKFGKPYKINQIAGHTKVKYYYKDIDNKKEYMITFTKLEMLYNKNTKKVERTKPNVISYVTVDLTVI